MGIFAADRYKGKIKNQKNLRSSAQSAANGLFVLGFEQSPGNHVRLGDIACVIHMQMIAADESRQYLCGVARVADGLVEVDHAIEIAWTANPGAFNWRFTARCTRRSLQVDKNAY